MTIQAFHKRGKMNETVDHMLDFNFDSYILCEENYQDEITYLGFSKVNFGFHEKFTFGVQWILFQTVGNILLVGLIQFDREGGDPLKRRITDQVSLLVQ